MTTNVFDGAAGVIATDSRWSVLQGAWLVYVDDARFEKIERHNDFAFMFAGKGDVIQSWKTWIRSNPEGVQAMPPCEGISVCIVDSKSKRVKFCERQDIVKDGAYFSGTGSRFAYLCWEKNRNAQRSVESAKEVDMFTGGEVKYLDMTGDTHNLHHVTNDVTIDMVRRALSTRGMVMQITGKIQSGAPFPLKDAAANDEELKDLQGKIASGAISPDAPCDGMHSEWTYDQKTRLADALSDVFGWKN